jgi:hypothetical protein
LALRSFSKRVEPQRHRQRVFPRWVGSGAHDVLEVWLKRQVLADRREVRRSSRTLPGHEYAFTGPGAISFDQVLGISWSGSAWGLFALALGLLGGVAQLFARKSAPAATTQKAV